MKDYQQRVVNEKTELDERAKKLSDFLEKLSSENKERMRLYFSRNIIAVTSFINMIPKVEKYNSQNLINWIESKIPENPEIRKKNYGQLNLKDYFKFMEKQ